ncbi:hypothetical protein [Bosea sp. 685]|uniref:hypothetical protein n=1 Tax=Bosea sp. 685 TaxID=3080057 RepID=UPI00289333D0|nr:hypothetical protein [Bosea sp. 685]WNJ92893.1 hypothetical protein RMR04_11605 [Bosea sp. 685]
MTQNAPKANADAAAASSRPVLKRLANALAGGACAFALSAPLVSEKVLAQGWQETTQYYRGGWTTTHRKLGPGSGGIKEMTQAAPGNNCPVSAFEVMNPKRGELRCVGYVAPSWLR